MEPPPFLPIKLRRAEALPLARCPRQICNKTKTRLLRFFFDHVGKGFSFSPPFRHFGQQIMMSISPSPEEELPFFPGALFLSYQSERSSPRITSPRMKSPPFLHPPLSGLDCPLFPIPRNNNQGSSPPCEKEEDYSSARPRYHFSLLALLGRKSSPPFFAAKKLLGTILPPPPVETRAL